MLGLTGGEGFLVAFIAVLIVSARWWPRLGAALATRLAGREDAADSSRRPATKSADD
jgi:hypothetical protein